MEIQRDYYLDKLIKRKTWMYLWLEAMQNYYPKILFNHIMMNMVYWPLASEY